MFRNFLLVALIALSSITAGFAGDFVMEEFQAGMKGVYTDCMNSGARPECCYPFGMQAGVLKIEPNWQEPEYCRNAKTDSKNGSQQDGVMSTLNARLDALYSTCLKSGPKECCDPLKDHSKAMPSSCRDMPAKKQNQQSTGRSAGAM